MRDAAEFMGALAIILVSILGVAVGLVRLGQLFDANECVAYAAETGRETRYARLSVLSGQCLTRSGDGRWLPVSQLRDEVDR